MSAARNLLLSVGERARVQLYREMSKSLGLDPSDVNNPWFTRPTETKK